MIKFNRHNVTNGTAKARCYYSRTTLRDGRECVTIYAKEYGRELGAMFPTVENETDSQTDYFEKDRVRIFAGDPLFAAACARCTANEAANAARWAKAEAKRAGRRQGRAAFAGAAAGTMH